MCDWCAVKLLGGRVQSLEGVVKLVGGTEQWHVKPGVGSHAPHAHADKAAGPQGCGRDDHGGEQDG